MIENRELAQMLLDWSNKQREADEMKEKIEAAVMEREEGLSISGVAEVKWRAGKRVFDYEKTIHQIPTPTNEYDNAVEAHSSLSVDWRGVCHAMGVNESDYIIKSQGKPTIQMKVL